MKRSTLIFLGLLFVILGQGCQFRPSPEDQAKIDALKIELKSITADISAAERKKSALTGGLISALVEYRIEVLKTTEALVKQHIHALESGGRISPSVGGTEPDLKLAESLELEIKKQEEELKAAQIEAARYAGGLLAALKQATVAMQEQSLAMLRSRYLAAKYGLPTIAMLGVTSASDTSPAMHAKPTEVEASEDVARGVVGVHLLRKRFEKADYQDYMMFDIEFTAVGLDKPARAIKGVLHFQDLFGEPKLSLNWSIDEQLTPGSTITERGSGFKFNQFMSPHQWVRATELKNMTASFTVKSILYLDGTRNDF